MSDPIRVTIVPKRLTPAEELIVAVVFVALLSAATDPVGTLRAMWAEWRAERSRPNLTRLVNSAGGAEKLNTQDD
jgi:hypothetical protein